MNEETPAAESPSLPSDNTRVEQEPATSIADHAAKFGPNAEPPDDAGVTAATVPIVEHPSSTQKRDDQGQWDRGRHRAKSQQARAEDVPRIKELTAKQRAAEERAERAERELAQLRQAPANPAASVPPIEARQPQVRPQADKPQGSPRHDNPRPNKLDTAKYPDGQFDDQYLIDMGRWAAREEHYETTQRTAKEEAEHAKVKSFGDGVVAARTKYPDFDAVALGPTLIRNESAIDLFIMEDENGAEVLYHLNKNPDEIRAIQAKSEIGQLKALSLLSQRFDAPQSRTPAAGTRSAAAPVISAVPRPPNLVRTGAHSVTADGPPTDGRPLSLKEHMKYWGPKEARR